MLDLYYQDSRSDKEYHIEIKYTSKGYQVLAKFGPRGGTLTHVDLTRGKALTYYEALDIYQKKVNEKRAKGYNESTNPTQAKLMKLTGWSFSYLGLSEWKKLTEAVEAMIEEAA